MGCFASKCFPPASPATISHGSLQSSVVEQLGADSEATAKGLTRDVQGGLSYRTEAENETGARLSPFLAFAVVASNEMWKGPIITSGMPQQVRKSRAACQKSTMVAVPYNAKVFDDVQFGRFIGRGSFGSVYEGIWHGKQVAVKLVEYEVEDDPCEGIMVEDISEAKLLQGLNHPGIVRLYAYAIRLGGSSVDSPAWYINSSSNQSHTLESWLLLEYCNKGSLQKAVECGWFSKISHQGDVQLDVAKVLATALEVSLAMEHIHKEHLVHGDLSTANVLLASSTVSPHGFTAKVADFGFGRKVTSTVWTSTLGTVTHMAPELIEDGKLTKSADVYSFGVLLWSIISGLPAWHGMTVSQVIYHVTAKGAALEIPVQCPLLLEDLLGACLSKDHQSRPTFSVLSQKLRSMGNVPIPS